MEMSKNQIYNLDEAQDKLSLVFGKIEHDQEKWIKTQQRKLMVAE